MILRNEICSCCGKDICHSLCKTEHYNFSNNIKIYEQDKEEAIKEICFDGNRYNHQIICEELLECYLRSNASEGNKEYVKEKVTMFVDSVTKTEKELEEKINSLDDFEKMILSRISEQYMYSVRYPKGF